ncbi:MAG: NAD-dependent epimerase/dehydratase family protein [Pseudomonadota bacterium]
MSALEEDRVLVVGAAGALGRRIVKVLLEDGRAVTAAYRTQTVERRRALEALADAGARVVRLDLRDASALAEIASDADAAVLTPILTISSAAAPGLARTKVRRALFFSSHNVTVDRGDPVYADLRAAEAALERTDLDWRILRPTMIYGTPTDGNVSRLIKAFARAPVAFRPGDGRALQQPIHYDDLARAAVAALDAPACARRAIDVGGPDRLTLADLYRLAAGGKTVLPIPVPALRLAAAFLGNRAPLSAAQLARIDADKTVEPDPAFAEVFQPRVRMREGVERLRAEIVAGRGP